MDKANATTDITNIDPVESIYIPAGSLLGNIYTPSAFNKGDEELVF